MPIPVRIHPARLQGYQTICGLAVFAVPRTRDMKDRVSRRQAAGVWHIVGHLAIAPELDDVPGAAKVVEHLPVPDRDEDIRARGDPRTRLGILTIALRSVIGDRCLGAARRERQRYTL